MRRSLMVEPALANYAQELVHLLLANRAELAKAANGKSIAPSSQYAAQVRKDMRQDVSAEVQRLLAVLVTDARDGNLLGSMLFVHRLEAIVREASESSTEGSTREAARLLPALSKDEERTNMPLNLAQQDLRESPDDAPTLERAIRCGRVQIAKTEAFVNGCERRLVCISGAVSGAGSGAGSDSRARRNDRRMAVLS